MQGQTEANFCEYLKQNSERQIDWIFITSNELFQTVITKFQRDVSERFHYVPSVTLQTESVNNEIIDNCAKLASNTVLFSIIFELEIPAELESQMERLFFKLKNGGFCRVVNLSHKNQKLLLSLCEKYNVYYDDIVH